MAAAPSFSESELLLIQRAWESPEFGWDPCLTSVGGNFVEGQCGQWVHHGCEDGSQIFEALQARARSCETQMAEFAREVERAASQCEMEHRHLCAGAHKDYITCTLMWHSTTDLDLHCVTPSGLKINFSHKQDLEADPTVRLDVDRNASSEGAVTAPVENIYVTRNAPKGMYRFLVRNHCQRKRSGGGGYDSSPLKTQFQCYLKVRGKADQVFQGELADKEEITAFEVVYDRDVAERDLAEMEKRFRTASERREVAAHQREAVTAQYNEIRRVLNERKPTSRLVLATAYNGCSPTEISKSDAYGFEVKGEWFKASDAGVSVELIISMKVIWDPRQDPKFEKPKIDMHSGFMLSDNLFTRSKDALESKYVLVDHWPGKITWTGSESKETLLAMFNQSGANIARSFGKVVCPVSRLIAQINELSRLKEFRINKEAQPAGSTCCLHSAIECMRALGAEVPSFEEYINRKKSCYFASDVKRAWVLDNPQLARNLGLNFSDEQ